MEPSLAPSTLSSSEIATLAARATRRLSLETVRLSTSESEAAGSLRPRGRTGAGGCAQEATGSNEEEQPRACAPASLTALGFTALPPLPMLPWTQLGQWAKLEPRGRLLLLLLLLLLLVYFLAFYQHLSYNKTLHIYNYTHCASTAGRAKHPPSA